MTCHKLKYINIKLIFSCLLEKLQDIDETSSQIIDQQKIQDMNEEGKIIEVNIEKQEPIFSHVNTTIETEKDNAVSKSLSNVLSDYVFIFLGICFYVAWAEVVVKAILLLVIFFAFFKNIQSCMKNFELDVHFNITIRQ